jgi:hypothetical protein
MSGNRAVVRMALVFVEAPAIERYGDFGSAAAKRFVTDPHGPGGRRKVA